MSYYATQPIDFCTTAPVSETGTILAPLASPWAPCQPCQEFQKYEPKSCTCCTCSEQQRARDQKNQQVKKKKKNSSCKIPCLCSGLDQRCLYDKCLTAGLFGEEEEREEESEKEKKDRSAASWWTSYIMSGRYMLDDGFYGQHNILFRDQEEPRFRQQANLERWAYAPANSAYSTPSALVMPHSNPPAFPLAPAFSSPPLSNNSCSSCSSSFSSSYSKKNSLDYP